MPQDFYPEIRFSGLVKSKTTGQPLKGIQVSIKEVNWIDYTNEKGEFLMFTEEIHQATLRFEDVDSTEHGSYASKDTLLMDPAEEIFLEIELEEE